MTAPVDPVDPDEKPPAPASMSELIRARLESQSPEGRAARDRGWHERLFGRPEQPEPEQPLIEAGGDGLTTSQVVTLP